MEFSWTAIVAIIGSCGTLIGFAVPVLKQLDERAAAKRKEKKENEKDDRQISTEVLKLKAERNETERDELKELYEIYKSRCAECEQQLKDAENLSILGRTKKREINVVMIKLSKNIHSMEKGFEEKYHLIELEAIFTAIKKLFTELEEIMP